MTKDAFQKIYHNFWTKDKEQAEREAERVNKHGIDDGHCVVAHLPSVGFCLMLEESYNFTKELGVV